MKKLILILFIFVACAATTTSCSKSDVGITARVQGNSTPSITGYSFYKVYEAGEEHVAFDVTFGSMDTTLVAKFNIYKYPSLLRATIMSPKPKKYTAYDHITLFPTYVSSTYYQFEFVMKDGSKIELDKFQVY